MSIWVGGGGFFFRAFTQTGVWFNNVLGGIGAGVFGNWIQVIAVTPFTGRWLDLRASNANVATEYRIQYGLGAPGFEIIWQPVIGSGIPGFPIELPPWMLLAPGLPISWNFPVSLPLGNRLVVRCSSAVGGGDTILLWTSIWG